MLQQIKTKLNELGFNLNHFALIGLFFVFVLGLTFTSEPLLFENLFKLKFLRAQSDDVVEQFIPETIAGLKISEDDLNKLADQKNKLSIMLDPTFSEGSVLGLSTESQDSITQILSDNNLEQIPVKTVQNSSDNIDIYLSQVKLIEDYYGSIMILATIANGNEQSVREAIPLNKKIISELKATSVPSSYVRYHRLKLMHYGIIDSMLKSLSGKTDMKSRSAAGILFFETQNAIDLELSKLTY